MAVRKKMPRMTEEGKRFIYDALKRNFSFDEEYPLANLGWCFLREGIDKADYGFLKLKSMLEEMSDFVDTSTKEVGGVSQSMFTLHQHDDFENASSPKKTSRQKKESKDTKEENNEIDSSVLKDTNSEEEIKSRKAASSRRKRSEASVEGESSSKAKVEAGSVMEEVSSRKTESASMSASKRTSKPKSASSASPDASQQTVATDVALNVAKAAASGVAPELPSGSACGPTRSLQGRVVPGKALERFADLGSWPDFLSSLASLALEEPWDFCEVPGMDVHGVSSKRYDILHNYIRYTFYRLSLEDKVAFSDDERFAAFNTGLVDKHYEDIYACFEPAAADGRRRWAFAGFCTAGTGRFGKRLVREMNPLPQPASYLQRKEDLLFDLDREVVCDIRHIVVDNVHRLPLNFLRDELASSAECRGILAGMEDLTERGRAARFERLRSVISDDPRLFARLSNSINAAIEQARRQVRWNYKTAVPAYYPRTNSMNLLLPLNLTEATTPDVALVIELQKSGNYQGQTIVTMAQAYRDARLLCRPYIDWLSPASIIDAASDEDEDE